jgi:hypothetical protein
MQQPPDGRPARAEATLPSSLRGPLLFARYAYAPNRLGYCGPDAADLLLGELSTGHGESQLRALAAGFEGAFPYLQLIAGACGIEDPLDWRVVEAYWLGGSLLRNVKPADLDRSMRERFWRRLDAGDRRWLGDKPAAGALPSHAFHVLELLPRMGLLRGGRVDRVLDTMDACRIRWGTVVAAKGTELRVKAPRLELVDGKLALGQPIEETVTAGGQTGGPGAMYSVGDTVAIHWGWACDRLTERTLRTLTRGTASQLAIANQTI